MKRDVKLYLQDIWESILAIEEYTGTLTEEEFYKNRQVQDAVLRRLEIIGEAVKNIDKHFRNRYPDIAWKKIAGMRDVLIHAYFGINMKRVWGVVKKDIPELKQEILFIMENKDV
ncbi:hypothetical protein ANME2D_03044 [Candidatus Methanoperedens nitroreducens]|uniref:DUF86 domain-containing protein n=1 Tax=Candidatus Methanoperedens nitratireducens TaxID=1392998 RepID=A0A062V6K6_9EURY|nr:DUF86 domain-containing protein [Candidatus Methanoperedens nitroreducens]KCZ71015.1 hypothetical protein ANME2D_03044 [Candidatus Methanoperedens nitroreducens]MDJ1421615.1 DUF86 domain-containing protein [Candidatus Methanoperedens sp.]